VKGAIALQRILKALETLRIGAAVDESEVQQTIADCLLENGIGFEREKKIGPGCRVDFYLDGGVVLEVKARKRPRKVLIDQLRRYCACAQVQALILVTNQATAVAASYGGKPVYCVKLHQLWGVAL
jgi:hypothetical protein